jgi:hypothetical protein
MVVDDSRGHRSVARLDSATIEQVGDGAVMFVYMHRQKDGLEPATVLVPMGNILSCHLYREGN